MIPAIVIFALAAVWIGGVMFGQDETGWAIVWTSVGSVVLGVLYSGMIRLAEKQWEKE